MKMEIVRNIEIPGRHGRNILADAFYMPSREPRPVIIFCHGFKGFKDWGAWNLMARWFCEQKFVVVKFNFSHNGTTAEEPEEFSDPEAFGQNNFEKELDDLDTVLDWLSDTVLIPAMYIDMDRIYLIGHSRGGGVAVIKAAEDDRIKKLATWAAVCDFSYAWTAEKVAHWKSEGVMPVANARTGQVLPMYYQLYENYKANASRFDIAAAASRLDKPYLIVHGTEDEAVPFEHALCLKRAQIAARLDLIPAAGHTFDTRHPFGNHVLPFDFRITMEHTADFFKAES